MIKNLNSTKVRNVIMLFCEIQSIRDVEVYRGRNLDLPVLPQRP